MESFGEPLDTVTELWLDNDMTTTTNTANAFAAMIDGMIASRRQYAADHGFEATADGIAADIKASLIRMMKEEG